MGGSKVIGIVFGILFGFIVIALTALAVFVCFYYSLYTLESQQSTDVSETDSEPHLRIRSKMRRAVSKMLHVLAAEDKEKRTASGATEERENHSPAANWIENDTSVGNIIVNVSQEFSTSDSDYRSALNNFEGDRSTEIAHNGHSDFQTFVFSNSIAALNDQYDSFSRTLFLQSLVEKSCPKESSAIKRVKDPYSDSYITAGGIVVVIHPFYGSSNSEFSNLQPGDLLRVVKFYVKDAIDAKNNTLRKNNLDSVPTIDLADSGKKFISGVFKNNVSENSLDSYLERLNLNYNNIYCSGIILNTYLAFNKSKDNLTLQFRDSSTVASGNAEMFKDFPLKVVSLETTVLRSLSPSQST